MKISGVEVYPANIRGVPDKEPVYIEFENEGVFKSQWGIVDQSRHATIHKDFTISFNDRCRYYCLNKDEVSSMQRSGVIVQF
jgi:hypothetical protein